VFRKLFGHQKKKKTKVEGERRKGNIVSGTIRPRRWHGWAIEWDLIQPRKKKSEGKRKKGGIWKMTMQRGGHTGARELLPRSESAKWEVKRSWKPGGEKGFGRGESS